MKKQRIYVDTSVIGGCLDEEFMEWSNGLMRDFSLGYFKAVVSSVVSAEILPAPGPVREKYLELMATEPEIIEISKEVFDLVKAYKHAKILGETHHNDMMHIALATVAGVDILTSWNFKHIVRFDKIRQFNGVHMKKGYKAIEIFSPREVTTHGKN